MLFFRLFRRVDPNCAYCRYGTRISERDVVCLKRGVVPVEHHCRAFRYDPLKRTPPRPAVLRLGGLGEADFSLEGAVPGQETLFAGMDGWDSGPEAAAEGPEVREGPEAQEKSETLGGPETAEEPETPGEPEELETPEEPEEPEEPEVPETHEAEEEELPQEAKKPVKVKVRAVRIRR